MPGEEVGSGYSGKKMKKKHTFREMFGIRDLFQGGKSVSDEEDSLQQKLAHVGAILRRRFLYTNMKEDSNGLGNRVRHSYCMPTFATLPVVTLLGVYLTDFYENMGVTLGYLSFFIALARSLDVISDPLMSSITDSCRSKYGRRVLYHWVLVLRGFSHVFAESALLAGLWHEQLVWRVLHAILSGKYLHHHSIRCTGPGAH